MGSTQVAAVQLIQDRFRRKDELIAQLNYLSRFPAMHGAASLLIPLLTHCDRIEVSAALIEEISTKLEISSDKQAALVAIQWMKKQVVYIEDMLQDIMAGLRLMDRLNARRYLKITFRLLPNAQIVNNGQQVTTDFAESTAELFLKSLPRQIAEREIEKRANLPPGSVVIHCPPFSGPKKIAKILIVSADISDAGEQKVEMLSEIDKIDKEVFGEHAAAIKALEAMYKSTWRFAVSVAPPHHANWQVVNNHIGDVIYEMLYHTKGKVPNDKYTVHEIKAVEARLSESGSPEPAIIEDITSSGEMPYGRLLAKLRLHQEFARIPEYATDETIDMAFRNFQLRIQGITVPGPLPVISRTKVGQPRKSNTRSISRKEFFDALQETMNVPSLAILHGQAWESCVQRGLRMRPDQLAIFVGFMAKFRPPTPIGQNALLQQNLPAFIDKINAGLDSALQ